MRRSLFLRIVWAIGILGLYWWAITIAHAQVQFNPGTQINRAQAAYFSNINKIFYADGYPAGGCTVGGTTYTTQLDCAAATADAWITANSAGAKLVVGAGTYNFCAPIILPALSGNWYTLSIQGASQEQTIFNLTCSLSNGTAAISHADNAYSGRLLLRDFRLTLNGNASSCIDLFGVSESKVENVNCSGAAGDGTQYSHFYTAGHGNGDTAGQVYQTEFINVTATGPALVNSAAQGAVTVNGSNVVTGITVTNGGAGYQSGYAYASIFGYGNLDAAHSWYPQPCYTQPSTIALTIASGAITAAVPSNDSANCTGTIYGVQFFNLAPVQYGFYINNATDNTFVDLNCGSADRAACIFNGGANNTYYHAHPNGGPFGIVDFGQGTFYGTECDSITQHCFAVESASQIHGTSILWNQAASANYYSNSNAYFFNGSIGRSSGNPAINGANVSSNNRCNLANVPTGFNDYWDQSGPFGTSVPAGVTITQSNPCGSTGTKQTVMGEDVLMNSTDIVKQSTDLNFNSHKTCYSYSYYPLSHDSFCIGTSGPTTAGVSPGYEALQFLSSGNLSATFPYAFSFGYSGAAGQATSSANVASPLLQTLYSWWDGTQAQYASTNIQGISASGATPIQTMKYFLSSTGVPGVVYHQFTGARLQLYNPTLGFTGSLDLAGASASVTAHWPYVSGVIATESDTPTSGNILQSCGVGCMQGSSYTPASTQVLHGTTASIGGSSLAANACTSGTATVTGATTTNPIFDPIAATSGAPESSSWASTKDFTVEARVTASNTVTVKVCALVAGTPTASVYYVRVLPQ